MLFLSVVTLACILCIMSLQVDTAKSISLETLKKFTAGDIISAVAFIPIATQLRRKVEEPGVGKGFVSSTKTPRELADKLFEAFFSTKAQVVTLKDRDVSGMEALQYLVAHGSADKKKKKTSKSDNRKYLHDGAQKSWDLANKRGNELKRKRNKNELKEQKGIRLPGCRWKYECEDWEDLDTCVLHTLCNDSALADETITHRRKASASPKMEDLQIRKSLGVTEIDEEVEKLLETRNAADHSDYVANEKLKKLTDRFERVMDRYLATSTASVQGLIK